MPIIQPPPAPPQKETIAVRLEVTTIQRLKRYAACVGTRNLSHVVGQCLERTFRTDSDYKAWEKAHPGPLAEMRPRRERSTEQSSMSRSQAQYRRQLWTPRERRVDVKPPWM